MHSIFESGHNCSWSLHLTDVGDAGAVFEAHDGFVESGV